MRVSVRLSVHPSRFGEDDEDDDDADGGQQACSLASHSSPMCVRKMLLLSKGSVGVWVLSERVESSGGSGRVIFKSLLMSTRHESGEL